MNDEGLFVERVRIAGMAILIARSLEEVDGREVAGVDGIVEIMHVVLVVGGVVVQAHVRHRGRTRMRGVGGRFVVLERLVVRNVIGLVGVGDEPEVVLRLQPVVPLALVTVRSKPCV